MADKVPQPIVVIISGPTATGKSDVAARICEQQSGMIVSADSVQAYRGVQIGANKPNKAERQQTPHVLIDIINHDVSNYNAAEWREDAIHCIQSLLGVSSSSRERQRQQQQQIDVATTPAASSDRRSAIDEYIKKSRIDKGYTSSSTMNTNNSSSSNNNNNNNMSVLPVVCGGTMMYIQWLVHGRPDAMRPSEKAVECAQQIINRFQQKGKNKINNVNDNDKEEEKAASAAVVEGDYDGAVRYVASTFGPIFEERVQKLSSGDWYRLRRTIEIAFTVKEKEKEQHRQTDEEKLVRTSSNTASNSSSAKISNNTDESPSLIMEQLFSGERQGSLSSLGYDVRCFFLCPDDRMNHTRIVDERCERMLQRGLIQETVELKSTGKLPQMAERAIGYRQTLDYLNNNNQHDDNEDDGDDTSIVIDRAAEEEAFEFYLNEFKTATRRYAKKQMSWFRKDNEFVFVPVSLNKKKSDRVSDAANEINRLCELSRTDYETELYGSGCTSTDGENSGNNNTNNDNYYLSFKTKRQNEEQGKKMKFYKPERHILKVGSKEYDDILAEAIDCRRKFRHHRRSNKIDDNDIVSGGSNSHNGKKRARDRDIT